MVGLKLAILGLLPVLVTLVLEICKKKFPGLSKSLLFTVTAGILFGLCAIYGTECGVTVGSAIVNTRDASVICAGLFFGWPAAVISAVIGSVERFLAPLWGVGAYTRLACSIATLIAGLITAAIVKFGFNKRKLHWLQGLSITFFVEVFHMLMVFVTHPEDIKKAYEVVHNCSLLLIGINCAVVVLAFYIVELVDKKNIVLPDSKSLEVQFNAGILIAMLIGFILTVGFSVKLQNKIAEVDTYNLLKSHVADVELELEETSEENYEGCTAYRHIGSSGYIIVADIDKNIISDIENSRGKTLQEIGFQTDPPKEDVVLQATIKDIDSYYLYERADDFYIIAVIPVYDAQFSAKMTVAVTVFLELIIFGILFAMLMYLIRHLVINDMEITNKQLKKITEGNLDVRLNLTTTTEVKNISSDINSTVIKLEKLIDEANKRIDQELLFAKKIQSGSLPSVFPPFPKIYQFDIFADMRTAKQVGGDFYDFFFTGSKTFYFLIADVSGKGIPAAMFMMRAKTLLRSLAQSNKPMEELARLANNDLCTENEAGMFVTCWIGKLDIYNGDLEYVNAGHNPPLIIRNGQKPEFLKNVSGLVLAGLPDIPYKVYSTKLNPGDTLYLYTDGVTEAMNTDNTLYSEQRLQDTLSKGLTDVTEICSSVLGNVDEFTNGAEQFDDITMLCLKYNGQ